MRLPFRIAPLALLLVPVLSHAQSQQMSAVGLEIPAPAPPTQSHFLSGAYVSANYLPSITTGLGGYAVQPYLRYVVGSPSRTRLYVQYNFTPFMVQQAFGSAASPYGAGGVELPANPGFAPLGARNAAFGRTASYGGLGAFSVGIPMQIGRSSAILNVGGDILTGLLRAATWQGDTGFRP